MDNEKRKSSRIKKPLVVQYSQDGVTWETSQVDDFSETGMQIITKGQMSSGAIFQFRTKIPLNPFNWLEFSAKIVDSSVLKNRFDVPVSDAYITRIEITQIKDEEKDILHRYIEWFLNEQKK